MLPVEQWVDLVPRLHDKSVGPVFDWVEARAKDIFDAASGDADVAAILDTVSGYTVAALEGRQGEAPITQYGDNRGIHRSFSCEDTA